MATGMALTVAQTLFSALQTKEVRELCSMVFEQKSRLTELQRTVETIKAVLEDAELKHQQLSNKAKLWLENLKDVVYDADDLFDELNTIALRHKRTSGSKISKEVLRFFSGDNKLLFVLNTSAKIKKLRKNLDSIARDHSQFGLGDLGNKPLQGRRETISYVYESTIIGRENDKKVVLGRLSQVSDAPDKHVSFVCIVGMGGLGKTALAQCVFNDDKFKTSFELSFWVCVSDAFGMKEIMCKMLGRSTDQRTAEELHKEVRQKIEGKRYFLVLDDVWEEDPNKWDELRLFLLSGAEGSSIIVTTRSKNVAAATGGFMHELKGLSDEDSLQLFKRVAFHQGSGQLDESLVDIGKDIVKKCANVPLSIRVMGSMLRGKDKSTWQSFQKNGLPMIGQGDDQTMSTLKYSYDYLESPLKTCFSYCALFPKDYRIEKEMLMNLWLAEGCIEHQNNVHDIEIGENYFWSLLQRCFFQDIKKNQCGEIYSFKMHDLIHDLATDIAGKEMRLVMDTSSIPVNDENIRHVSLACQISECLPQSSSNPSNNLGKLRKMRTFLRPCGLLYHEFEMDDKVLINCKKLRVLDLHRFKVCEQPLGVAMKNLYHLRYLDLSENRDLEMLPKAISKLYNLQVLNLRYCEKLRELPANLKEMVNLKCLDTYGCKSLTHMPGGMGNLTSLYKLSMFVVDGGSSNQVVKGQVKDLAPLYNLRGELKIELKNDYSCDATSDVESKCLENKAHLKALEIIGSGMDDCLIESLQPHQNIERIKIDGYKSIRLPRWVATMVASFPHLVKITLEDFEELQQLPQFSQLQHLKILALKGMPHVEYMEDDLVANPFFPSLEDLTLWDFPKLKRWWRSEVVGEVERGSVAFSRLVKLDVKNCPIMTSFPGCPIVRNLQVSWSKEALTFCREGNEASESQTLVPAKLCCSSSSVLPAGINKPTEIIREDKSGGDDVIYLDKVWINNMGVLNSVLRKSPLSVAERCVFIQNLDIFGCHELKSLRDVGIQHLTNLHTLKLWNCNNLEMEEGEEEMMPWKALHKLCYLWLSQLNKVVNLPKGIQCLSTLQQLYISCCEKLEGLPEWLHHLTSLENLEIYSCKNLKSLPEAIGHMPSLNFLRIYMCNDRLMKERLKEPDGVDWLKIRHIPKVSIEMF